MVKMNEQKENVQASHIGYLLHDQPDQSPASRSNKKRIIITNSRGDTIFKRLDLIYMLAWRGLWVAKASQAIECLSSTGNVIVELDTEYTLEEMRVDLDLLDMNFIWLEYTTDPIKVAA